MKGLFFLVSFALIDLGFSFFIVLTTNGLIIGHSATGVRDVQEFLGIPYAKPPVADLRFSAPRRPSLKLLFEASNDCLFTASSRVDFPNETPQFKRVLAAFAGQNNNPQSEDCLTLNIWSGANNGKSRKKPVLVFFYGGRYTTGATNTPYLNGKYFAEAQDVVIVTVNYRVNIFGFPGAPGITQNLGLLDQRLAVEWVRDNAKAFGGDPKRITIFGQSAGSVAVDFWSYAWAKDPIVAGLISHSGTAFSFPVNSRELATRHWYNASTLLGCGSSGDVMPCMRRKSATEIKKAITAIPPPPGSSVARSQPVFQPTPDGRVVFDNYASLSSGGKFARIPYVVGHTDNEAGFYNISAYARGNILTPEEWEEFNYEVFSCPTSQTTADRAKHGVPVWRFRYYADWDNTRLHPNSRAYHGVDLHMIFGASRDVSGLPESQEQTKLKKVMQNAWARFAADPRGGLKQIGWPTFKPKEKTLIQLGLNNEGCETFINPMEFDRACGKVSS
ncbi:hypothetical protein PABG_05662 [Paracoccidioides brasiliensis Pb03]|nr:hypothetical protein PABG_05662 [Paracoccidioides brasiliensis Pb03]